jgi:hypothetical protein
VPPHVKNELPIKHDVFSDGQAASPIEKYSLSYLVSGQSLCRLSRPCELCRPTGLAPQTAVLGAAVDTYRSLKEYESGALPKSDGVCPVSPLTSARGSCDGKVFSKF